MNVIAWNLTEANAPFARVERESAAPGAGEVAISVAGCGVCHTDLGFARDGVPTRHALPLTLGHEIAGRVIATGAGAEAWAGKAVVVPAVIPCGTCPACAAGRGSICPKQIFPGNDVHGGFATEVVVPARGLCPVPALADPLANPKGLELWELSVIADAISTPYQAIERAGVGAGDLAVFVGVGGVGGFGVQIARARGAQVVAIDIDAGRLALMSEHGAALTLRADEHDKRALKKLVRGFAKERGVASWRQFIFETSGTPAGQQTAFSLLGHGAYLGVVGYTPRPVELRLSNLMAFDATAQGNWGCLPEHYPAVLDLVLSGAVAVRPFIERRPLESINAVFDAVAAHEIAARVVLVPENPS